MGIGAGVWDWLQMFLVFAGVLLLAYFGSRWYAEHYSGRRTDGLIEVLAVRSLTRQGQIMVVQIADRVLALGVTADGVQVLCEWEEPAAILQAIEDTSGGHTETSFDSLFRPAWPVEK